MQIYQSSHVIIFSLYKFPFHFLLGQQFQYYMYYLFCKEHYLSIEEVFFGSLVTCKIFFQYFLNRCFFKNIKCIEKVNRFQNTHHINVPVGPVTYITYFNTLSTHDVFYSMTSIGLFNVLYLCMVFIESKLRENSNLVFLFHQFDFFFYLPIQFLNIIGENCLYYLSYKAGGTHEKFLV